MRKSKYSKEQILGFLKHADAGMLIKELCRKGGFSDATFYKWRSKFGGMEVPDARRLRELEAENGSSGCWPRRTWTCTRSRAFSG